jgi:hypothetical protein
VSRALATQGGRDPVEDRAAQPAMPEDAGTDRVVEAAAALRTRLDGLVRRPDEE